MKYYLCITQYAATCEGWHVQISLHCAKSKNSAKEKHWAQYEMDPFFQVGTKVYHKKEDIRAALSRFFDREFVNFLFTKDYYDQREVEPFFGFTSFNFSFDVNRS